MKNQFVGDAGDFGKYGLLRLIFSKPHGIDLKLGFNWYLTPNEQHKKDGKKIKYLLQDTRGMGALDGDLYKEMKDIVQPVIINREIISKGDRNIRHIESRGICNAAFYNALLENESDRPEWHNNALKELSKCDVVFLDPDNGIQPSQKYDIKHVSRSEIKDYFMRGQSLVVFQDAEMGHEQKRIDLFIELKNEYRQAKMFYTRYSRYGVKLFLFILHHRHYELVRPVIDKAKKGPWFEETGEKHIPAAFKWYEID